MKTNALGILVFFISFFFYTVVAAQNKDATNVIDRKKWEKSAENYDYSKEKADKPEKEKRIVDKSTKKSTQLSPATIEIIKYTLFVTVIVLLVFLGYKLLKNGKYWDNKNLEMPKVYTVDNIEENLDKADVDLFLNEALRNGNYRLALRLMYLNILKSLAQKDKITWKKDKTNGDYLNEMMQNSLYEDFRKCTLVYEIIWFSELKDFNKSDFEKTSSPFDKLLSAINSPKKTA